MTVTLQYLEVVTIIVVFPIFVLCSLKYLEKIGFHEEETTLILAGVDIGTILLIVSYLLSKVLRFLS